MATTNARKKNVTGRIKKSQDSILKVRKCYRNLFFGRMGVLFHDKTIQALQAINK